MSSLKAIRRLLTQALYWLPAQIFDGLGFHIVKITNQSRIGHLISEPDWYIRKVLLGEFPRKRPLLLLNKRKVANFAVVDMLRQRFVVITNPIARKLLSPFTKIEKTHTYTINAVATVSNAALYYETFAQSVELGQIWDLPQELLEKGQEALKGMGLPEDAWYVCVHSREGGYSPEDEHMHSHRNSTIASYRPAIEEIVAAGGWCIRMGDPSMTPMEPMDKVIDYAVSDYKSDWLDVFLCAHCRFFLGNSSGLYLLSTVHNIPSVLANMAPLSAVYGVNPADISIPKLTIDGNGSPLSFREILDSELANQRQADNLKDSGVSFVSNTPTEIKEITLEMLETVSTDLIQQDPDEEARQQAFKALFGPHHYTFGSKAKIGKEFLKRYQNLLD